MTISATPENNFPKARFGPSLFVRDHRKII